MRSSGRVRLINFPLCRDLYFRRLYFTVLVHLASSCIVSYRWRANCQRAGSRLAPRLDLLPSPIL